MNLDLKIRKIINNLILSLKEKKRKEILIEDFFLYLLKDEDVILFLSNNNINKENIEREILEFLKDKNNIFKKNIFYEIKRKRQNIDNIDFVFSTELVSLIVNLYLLNKSFSNINIENIFDLILKLENDIKIKNILLDNGINQNILNNKIVIEEFILKNILNKELMNKSQFENNFINSLNHIFKKNNNTNINFEYIMIDEDLNQNNNINFDNKDYDINDDYNTKEDYTSLYRFCDNMNNLYKDGKYDKLIERDNEIDRIIQILSRKKKNNPLLLGDAGVGKTAIIEGLVKRIEMKEVPKNIENINIFNLDLNALIAGTRYRGEFEENLQDLIDEIIVKDNVILFIDEIHNLSSLGGEDGNAMEILKPYLARGEITIIGATTFEEVKYSIEKDKAIDRRFQKISILEPNLETTFKIIDGIKEIYEKHHNIIINDQNIKDIVSLSDRYILNRKFPDKAIDVIDELGANRKLSRKRNKSISYIEICETISKITKTPINPEKMNKQIINLEKNIKKKLFGQSQAITPIINKIIMKNAGLIAKDKPIGTFLLFGTSGTGKTELGKQISKYMNMNLLRYDMSEYSEENSVAKLFGTSAGYIGYEDGGRLIEDVKKNPYSVIIFDEIEKANKKVINSLLQVLEEAEGTSGDGRKVNFQHTLILFTSNAGSKTHIEKTMGFNNIENKSKQTETINKIFSPEFRNRLDAIIEFNDLNKNDLFKIIDKYILEIEDLVKEKNIKLKITKKAKEWLSSKGYNKDMGARPLYRLIEKHIKLNISKEILLKNINNKVIKIELNKEELILK